MVASIDLAIVICLEEHLVVHTVSVVLSREQVVSIAVTKVEYLVEQQATVTREGSPKVHQVELVEDILKVLLVAIEDNLGYPLVEVDNLLVLHIIIVGAVLDIATKA